MTPSVRDQLLAASANGSGSRAIPCPACPVPGVFVAKLSAAKFLDMQAAMRGIPEGADELARRRLVVGVQLAYAIVGKDGAPLMRSPEEALALDADVAVPVLELFLEENGLTEKKSPPASRQPAG